MDEEVSIIEDNVWADQPLQVNTADDEDTGRQANENREGNKPEDVDSIDNFLGTLPSLIFPRDLPKLIDECMPLEDEAIKNDGPYQLYDLLDNAENGRKRMYKLLSSRYNETKVFLNYHKSQLFHEFTEIVGNWKLEEKRATRDTKKSQTAAAIEDSAIVFSWSALNKQKGKLQQQDVDEHIVPESDKSTNQKLYEMASVGLNKIYLKEKKLKQEKLTDSNEPDKESTDRDTNSKFKMDPLEQFVAQALPKEPKHKRKKNKRKSTFWFWGKGNSNPTTSHTDESSSHHRSSSTTDWAVSKSQDDDEDKPTILNTDNSDQDERDNSFGKSEPAALKSKLCDNSVSLEALDTENDTSLEEGFVDSGLRSAQEHKIISGDRSGGGNDDDDDDDDSFSDLQSNIANALPEAIPPLSLSLNYQGNVTLQSFTPLKPKKKA